VPRSGRQVTGKLFGGRGGEAAAAARRFRGQVTELERGKSVLLCRQLSGAAATGGTVPLVFFIFISLAVVGFHSR